jgi:LemA protein
MALAAAGCNRYDALVAADQNAERAWADVEAQLQRRSDLIPNLVSTVKGSAAHEQQTLSAVVQARASATQIRLTPEDMSDPAKMEQFSRAQDQLKGALSRLLLVQEQYPDLKANASFRDLQIQIEGTENRILRAREEYNRTVAAYNTELRRVRGMVVNRLTGRPFKARVYFKATPESQAVPKVSF